jgi:hypothetical protein
MFTFKLLFAVQLMLRRRVVMLLLLLLLVARLRQSTVERVTEVRLRLRRLWQRRIEVIALTR